MKLRSYLTAIAIAVGCASFVPPAVDAAPLGHWPNLEGSGANVANTVAGGAAGTIGNLAFGGLGPGGAVWTSADDLPGLPGVSRSVLSFNGTGDGGWVAAGEIPQLTLDADFTWAFWAKQQGDNADPNRNDIIVGNRRNAEGNEFDPRQFIKFTPTNFEWHGQATGENLTYPEPIPFGSWIQHAVVKDGDSMTYYRDGVEIASRNITLAMDFPLPLYFGGDPTARAGENWSGLLADVWTFDSALSADEIRGLTPSVPEPASGLMLLMGALALVGRRARR